MPAPVTVILIILLILCAMFFGFTYYAYSVAFKRKKIHLDLTRDLGIEEKYAQQVNKMTSELRSLEYEEVTITAIDGIKLRGRYYHAKDGAPIEIFCHGYRSSPTRDFANGAIEATKHGINALLIYQRAHGKSEGRTITFGAKERYDVLAWARYMTERFGDGAQIILCGISMGASTVIQCSELDLPKTVKCIVADCPYSSAEEILTLTASKMKFPGKAVYPFIRLGARIYGGFDPADASAYKSIRNARLPILLIHGEADRFVPKYMSDKIYENAKGKDVYYYTFPSADHGMSFIIDAQRYIRIRTEFTERYVRYIVTDNEEGEMNEQKI